jgi:hypothetical protein
VVVALFHRDSARRADARKVLDQLLGIAAIRARTDRRRLRRTENVVMPPHTRDRAVREAALRRIGRRRYL